MKVCQDVFILHREEPKKLDCAKPCPGDPYCRGLDLVWLDIGDSVRVGGMQR